MSRRTVTREQAYQALYDLVKTVALPGGDAWGLQQRGIKSADECGTANQPAMFVCQATERASKRMDTGAQNWEFWAAIVVYFRTNPYPVDEDWQYANAILDSLEEILYDRDGRQTLGGLVTDCFIMGDIVLFPESEQTEQQTLLIPVVMILGE
jgi:hypothetical protein